MNTKAQKHTRVMVVLVCALALSACATITPYQPAQGNNGYGYSEQKLQTNRYRVSFSGNSKTDRNTVENYLLYRAAELTLAQGGDSFVVSNQDTEKNTRTTGVSAGTGFGYPFFFGPGFGGTTTTNTQHDYDAYGVITIHKGTASSDQPNIYNARDLQANLGPDIKRPK